MWPERQDGNEGVFGSSHKAALAAHNAEAASGAAASGAAASGAVGWL